MSEPNDDLCHLRYAAGRSERCLGPRCPFFGERGCALSGLRADLVAEAA